MIKFSKSTGACRIFTTEQVLPNNTVYSIVMDAKGVLWCSSNKGIFSFDRKVGSVLQTFTSKDGFPAMNSIATIFFSSPTAALLLACGRLHGV